MALLAGGRYDALSSQLGGPSIPCIGWAAGIDRLCAHISAPSDAPLVAVGLSLSLSSISYEPTLVDYSSHT